MGRMSTVVKEPIQMTYHYFFQAEIYGWLNWIIEETGAAINSPGLVDVGANYPVCVDVANWTLATLTDLDCETLTTTTEPTTVTTQEETTPAGLHRQSSDVLKLYPLS